MLTIWNMNDADDGGKGMKTYHPFVNVINFFNICHPTQIEVSLP